MSRSLNVISIGPGVSIQDQGRPGHLGSGLSRSGAADQLALAEGAALLGQPASFAALEMAGFGGEFTASADLRIALTGAPMRAMIDGEPLLWNASYTLPKGARLSIGAATAGVYGYLHVGGGFETPLILGARAAHLAAGLGGLVAAGATLPVGTDKASTVGLTLPVENRFSGGTARVIASLQTAFFPQEQRARFGKIRFHRDIRANRQGVRLIPEGDGFHVEGGLNVLSEIIVPGDIQVTGDGTPYVLLPEAQTTGGYPRIGTVLPCDLPMLAQATPGAEIRFTFVELDAALKAHESYIKLLRSLPGKAHPLHRDPRDIADLLSYQLISGMITGEED